MLKITELFREILAGDSASARAVMQFLTLPITDANAGRLAEAAEQAAEDALVGLRLTDALILGGDNRKLESVLDSNEWAFGTQDLDYLDADSTVGWMCLALIVRSDFLTADMRDASHDEIRKSVQHQCGVWLFG